MGNPKTLIDTIAGLYLGVSSETSIVNLSEKIQSYAVPASFMSPDAKDSVNLRVARNDVTKVLVKLNGWAEAAGLPDERIDVEKIVSEMDHYNYPEKLRLVGHLFSLASGRIINHLGNKLDFLKTARNVQSIEELRVATGASKSSSTGPESRTSLGDTRLAKIKAESSEIDEQLEKAIAEKLSKHFEIEEPAQS